jgi:N utilization substance protein B
MTEPRKRRQRLDKPGSKIDRGRARASARLAAVQALYQMELSGQGTDAVIEEFIELRFGMDVDGDQIYEADAAFFGDLVRGVIEHQTQIDRAIDEFLAQDWPLARLEAILRALLRPAAFELLIRGDVPARVVLNEYVDLGSAFFGEAETVFANGVLNRLARSVRAAEFVPIA